VSEQVQPTTRRGRPATTSRDEIVRAATEVARRDGLPNLTMSRLAEHLGVSTMTPYSYVANRQQLGELVVDAALATVEVPDAAIGDWKQRLSVLQSRARQALLDLKGTNDVICRAAAASIPEGHRLATAIVAILQEAGFDPIQATLGYEIIYTYVVGQLGLDEAVPERERLHLGPLTAVPDGGAEYRAEDVFSIGLEMLLDGLERSLPRAEGSARPRRPVADRPSGRPVKAIS
jgi:AcrR family transcriptional regulator